MSGTPYLAGSGSAASGGSVTLTVALSTNVSSLDTILVGVLVSAAGVTPSVSDTAGNNYSQVLADTTETTAQLYVFESDGSNPLTAGTDDVIVVYSANTSVQGAIVVGDNNVTGADKLVIAHGSSTSPSSGSSGTLSQAEEHAIGFICDAFAGGVPTWAAPWSSNVLGNVSGGSTTRLSAAFQDVTATTALTASGTITSAVWSCAIVTTEVAPVTPTLVMSDGVANEAYSQTLEASGGIGPYTWTTTGTLPTGTSLSAGVISGTPTVAGTYTFTTTATDAHSVVGSLVQSVTILASGASVAPALTLPNNMLTPADSDFEVTGFTWAADTNANAPARSSHTSLTGSECLSWVATADGDTRISTGFYAVKPNLPYIAAGFIMPCGQRDTDIGIEWYTSGNVLIGSAVFGGDNPSSTIAWQPLTGNFTAPATAAKCKIVVEVQEANKGDVNHIDLMYFTQTGVQVLIDWTNPTFDDGGEAGQDFMDVSMFVRMDQGINLTSGRQDSISEVQPGSGTFILQNDTGVFSRSKSTALVTALGGAVTLQRRCQVNLTDEHGVWYTRADGPISEADYSFDNTGLTSQVMISITDVLAYLNREDSMTCWTKENVLNDSPQYHWSLDDAGNAGGSGVAAETSGNNGPPMRLINSDKSNVATIAFQDTTGGVETLADTVAPGQPDGSEYWSAGSNQPASATRGLDAGVQGPYTSPIGSIYLTPVLTSETAQNYFIGNQGYMLQAVLPEMTPNATGTDFSYEVWFTMDPLIGTDVASHFGPYTILSLGSSNRTGFNINCGVYLATNHLVFLVESRTQPPGFVGRNFSGSAPLSNLAQVSLELETDTVQLPHHLVLTIQGDPSAPVVSGWFDGRAFGDSTDDTGTGITVPAGTSFDTLCIGGSFGGTGNHFGGVSLASVYNYYIPGSQAFNHANMGQYGMWEATTDDCIAQLATFAGIPSFWSNITNSHNGLTMTEYQDITGSNPLSNMQLFEQAESGLLFVDRTGALNFHTRDWRMGYGAPDLLLPPDSFDGAMGYELIDQFMQNESAIATQTYQTGAAFVNDNSQSEYGTYATNPVDSPLQLPLITLNRGFGQLGLAAFNYFADPNLTDLAAWNANIYSDPFLMPGQLTVDLLTLDPTTGLGISNFYALEIDNMIAPTGTLPSSFPDSQAPIEWFIEGISETVSQGARTIQFFCSPAATQRAWIPGDSTYGVLGATARIGISESDLSTPQADGKDVSHDAGRPYWPPGFSSTMNNPSGNGHSFIGALDIRGLTDNLSLMLNPPMCVVSANTGLTQTVASGPVTTPQIFWDTVHVDTVGGMGLVPGWPNWYVCLVPGFYDIDGCIEWAGGTTGGATACQGFIIVAQAAAQWVAMAPSTNTPVNVDTYVCPLGEQVFVNVHSQDPVTAPTTRLYLGVGDMVTIGGEQSTGSNRATATTNGGSHMSILYRGMATADDRVQINNALSFSGSGSAPVNPPKPTSGTKTYNNTHTYAYYGAAIGYNRKNSDGPAYQGTYSGGSGVTGSEVSQIVFNHSQMASDLSGQTITSVTLRCHNQHFWYDSGGKLMLGWSSTTPGGSNFHANHSGDHTNLFSEGFSVGQTKTFSLPVSFGNAFKSSGAKALLIGNDSTTNLDYYGFWQGGPGNWTLTIKYHS